MRYYYGKKRTKSYFEGWYFKCQTHKGKCLALIPAIHIDGEGTKSASIQVITEDRSWCIPIPAETFHAQTEDFRVQVGHNLFSERGMKLRIHEDGIDLKGNVRFGPFWRLKSPIMGPFRFVPNLECAHSVISMKHALKGELVLNGKRFDFDGGLGYIESDRGSSFPSAYLWAQDTWENGSFMLSVASIPLGGLKFTGCICEILLNDRSYRIATYLGARVTRWSSDDAEVRQGGYRLEVKVLHRKEQPLKAPCVGKMVRTVHESLCSEISIRFSKGERILLERLTDRAGFEFSDRQ